MSEFKITLTYNWEIRKSEEPLHSYIIEKSSAVGIPEIRYGPVPDVLIGEVLHELRELKKSSIRFYTEKLVRGAMTNE